MRDFAPKLDIESGCAVSPAATARFHNHSVRNNPKKIK